MASREQLGKFFLILIRKSCVLWLELKYLLFAYPKMRNKKMILGPLPLVFFASSYEAAFNKAADWWRAEQEKEENRIRAMALRAAASKRSKMENV